MKDDKSDREGSTDINRAVKEHFKQRKCNWYQCGGMGKQTGRELSEKGKGKKPVCRGGRGLAYRRKGFVLVQG